MHHLNKLVDPVEPFIRKLRPWISALQAEKTASLIAFQQCMHFHGRDKHFIWETACEIRFVCKTLQILNYDLIKKILIH